MRHYAHVPREQLQGLKAQIQERIARFASELPSLRKPTPRGVDQALSEQVAEARSLHRQLEHDLEALADPRRRRKVVEELPDFDEILFPDVLSMDSFFAEPARRPRSGSDGRRRKRGKARRR